MNAQLKEPESTEIDLLPANALANPAELFTRASIDDVIAVFAINEIGAFVAPYGWGAAKDATGSFQLALIAFSIVALLMSALILLLRKTVDEGRAPLVQCSP